MESMTMKMNKRTNRKIMQFSKSVASLLLVSLLHGCVLLGAEANEPAQTNSEELAPDEDILAAEDVAQESSDAEAITDNEAPAPDAADEEKSAELTKAENQVKELSQQLSSLKIEWEQQKPALERLVNNEADLEFLVQSLADMSQLADEPSRDQYLGADELTPEKRQESLEALQSLVTTQEELNSLLVELSNVVSDVAANSQAVSNQTVLTETSGTTNAGSAEQSAEMPLDGQSQPNQVVQTDLTQDGSQVTQNSSAPVVDVSTGQAPQQSTMTNGQTATQSTTVSSQVTADCNCSDPNTGSSAQSDPARAKDPSWYASTTTFTEAAPAGGSFTTSQLDNGAASGQPIPNLQVKTFKRRTLPSELAAAGADMQQYAMAPKFHMSRKSLSDYVSQLAFKLAGNQQLAGNRIGVASFVFFDEQLEQTSSVGNQLAEELSTVLPNYGARVVEYKLTREITVSPTGDLSLSRNTKKLRDSQGMDYVLTGTMVPTRRGLQINSRVVSTRDNVVIASATTLIPAMVLQQL